MSLFQFARVASVAAVGGARHIGRWYPFAGLGSPSLPRGCPGAARTDGRCGGRVPGTQGLGHQQTSPHLASLAGNKAFKVGFYNFFITFACYFQICSFKIQALTCPIFFYVWVLFSLLVNSSM